MNTFTLLLILVSGPHHMAQVMEAGLTADICNDRIAVYELIGQDQLRTIFGAEEVYVVCDPDAAELEA